MRSRVVRSRARVRANHLVLLHMARPGPEAASETWDVAVDSVSVRAKRGRDDWPEPARPRGAGRQVPCGRLDRRPATRGGVSAANSFRNFYG